MGSDLEFRKTANKLRLLAGVSAAGLVLMAMPAMAQDKAPESLSNGDDAEIVVSGLRYSMDTSTEIKRSNEGIVEAVVATDIGKLPDLSVAESLSRLPGVAAQRIDGRAQDLSIRGMGPDFSVTLFNGNEMVSTGDDRSFEYDQLPAELVNSMVVYKTSDVSLSSQGLAGTIDIRTVHPLDVKGRKITLNARAEANSYGKLVPGVSNHGERLSASYVDQFADGHFGIALGFSHLGSPVEKKYFNPWDFGTADDLYVIDALGNTLAGNPMTMDGFETGTQSIKTARDSFLGVLEYKSDSGFHSVLNYFHSEFNQHMRGDEVVGVTAGWAPATESHVTLPNASNALTQAVTNATYGIVFRGNDRKDRINGLDWNNELEMGAWKVRADLSWSKAHRHETIAEAYAANPTPTSYTVAFPTAFRQFGQVTSNALDFSKTSNFLLATYFWGPPAAYRWIADVKDETKSGKLSLHRDWDSGLLTSLDLGAVFAQRTKALNQVGTSYSFSNPVSCFSPDYSCSAIPAGLVSGTAPMAFNGLGNVMFIDVINAIGTSAYTVLPSDPRKPRWNWSVEEKTYTGFAKLGFGGDLLIPWKGSLGVQIVSVDQSATGIYVDGNGTQTPNLGGKKYTDVLPSLVLTGDLGRGTKLRFGVARAVSRPNMADLRAAVNASVGQVIVAGGGTKWLWSGSGGNPSLKPWLSTDLDLSIEHYFGPGSYVSLAAFDKIIKRGIITETSTFDFTGLTNTSGHAADSNIGSFDMPVNINGGWVRGLELSLSLDGKVLSDALEGFGFSGSYAYTDSSLPGVDVNGYINPNLKLEGLSKNVVNATFFYDRNGIQFRIAERYRSGYSATRHNAFAYVIDTIRPELLTDLQLGYTFQSGALNGLGIVGEVNNLFDEPYSATQTVGGKTALKEFHKFGRQYLLGLTYKF